ncbi:MAG: hypothetical protein MHM6MM_001402 [Cercozoa sp. M6MM]
MSISEALVIDKAIALHTSDGDSAIDTASGNSSGVYCIDFTLTTHIDWNKYPKPLRLSLQQQRFDAELADDHGDRDSIYFVQVSYLLVVDAVVLDDGVKYRISSHTPIGPPGGDSADLPIKQNQREVRLHWSLLHPLSTLPPSRRHVVWSLIRAPCSSLVARVHNTSLLKLLVQVRVLRHFSAAKPHEPTSASWCPWKRITRRIPLRRTEVLRKVPCIVTRELVQCNTQLLRLAHSVQLLLYDADAADQLLATDDVVFGNGMARRPDPLDDITDHLSYQTPFVNLPVFLTGIH